MKDEIIATPIIDPKDLKFSVEDVREIIGEKNRFIYIFAKSTLKVTHDLQTEKIIGCKNVKKRWIVLDAWRPYLSADGKSKKCARANLIRKYGA